MQQKVNKETQEKIQQLQILEQNLQSLLMQKQAFQYELNETENAISEVEKTSGDVYKMIGQVMIKTKQEEVSKQLGQKKDILDLRVKAIEKQESRMKEESEKIRTEVMEKIN
jgi:prefoldin beta subunit